AGPPRRGASAAARRVTTTARRHPREARRRAPPPAREGVPTLRTPRRGGGALGCASVYAVLEPPPQVERACHRVVAVAGQPELACHRVHHLLGRRDTGRGDEHEERHLLRGGRGERSDPAALAEPP